MIFATIDLIINYSERKNTSKYLLGCWWVDKTRSIVARGFLTPLFYEGLLYYLTPLFSNSVHPLHPPQTKTKRSFCYIVSLTESFILTPTVMCSQHLFVLHWKNTVMISKKKLYRVPQCLWFSKMTYVKGTHLMIRFNNI